MKPGGMEVSPPNLPHLQSESSIMVPTVKEDLLLMSGCCTGHPGGGGQTTTSILHNMKSIEEEKE